VISAYFRALGSVCTSGDGPGLQNALGRFWTFLTILKKNHNLLFPQGLPLFCHLSALSVERAKKRLFRAEAGNEAGNFFGMELVDATTGIAGILEEVDDRGSHFPGIFPTNFTAR
jgi:hypothetical protein